MRWRSHLTTLLIALTCLPTTVGAVRSLVQERPALELGWEGVVEQSQPNYCGPAVIATLLGRLEVQVLETEVASTATLRPDGISLAEFSRLAGRYELVGYWFEVGSETELESLPLPAVVHLAGAAGHFAILERSLNGFVQLADPARGRVLVPEVRFERAWTRRIFIFENHSLFQSLDS